MTRARVLVLALVGLALPAGLALGVYAASESSLAAVPTVVRAPVKIASPQTTAPATAQHTTTRRTTTRKDDDLPGKCDDPKHALDPDCDPRADADSSSGGSGGDERDGDGDSSDHDSDGDD